MASSCIRIDPKDFHGPEAMDYTQRALEELSESRQFKSYLNHVEYKDRLHLTWFLIPLSLVSVFYYHLSVFGPDLVLPGSALMSTTLEERAVDAPGLPYVTLFVILFLLPCTLVAPFSGFFEEPTAPQSLRLFVLLSVTNAAVVSYGGPLLHHPPFLHTSPAISWLSVVAGGETGSHGLSIWAALKILTVRALPLQGFLFAGYAVSQWQRAFWRRVWHLPLPLFSVPLLVGLCGVTFGTVSSLVLPYFFNAEGQSTSVATYSWSAIRSDPLRVLSLWRSVAEEVVAVMINSVRTWAATGGGLPMILANTTSCVHAYLAGMSLALVYFSMLAARPILEFLISGVCFILPVDPTIWGLTLVSSVGALVALLRMEEVMLPYVAVVSGLVFLLLYNGFVA